MWIKFKLIMDLIDIINRNYIATVKRGKIIKKTTIYEFIEKIYEEVDELNSSWLYSELGLDFDEFELADIIIVCLCMAKHFKVNINDIIEQKTIINETRKD